MDIWAFLQDESNRAMLGWIGGGIVAVAGGLWAVVKFYAKEGEASPTPGVRSDRGSAAIGGDNVNSPIKIDARSSGKR
jgi:hypothetical protein